METLTSREATGALRAYCGSVRWIVCIGAVLGILHCAEVNASTITVTTVTDEDNGTLLETDGTGVSLREAINHSAHGSTIVFGPGVFQKDLHVALGHLVVDKTLVIFGESIRNGTKIQGNGSSRIFSVTSTGDLTLSDMSLSGGSAPFGAGILNQGVLSLTRCTISNNHTTAGVGGGLYNDNGAVTIHDCLFHQNSSAFGNGGAIQNRSSEPFQIHNTTLHQNSANPSGAAFFNVEGLVQMTFCTVTENLGGPGASAISSAGDAASGMELSATIVRDNDGFDVVRANGTDAEAFTSQGYNIIGTGSGVLANFNQTGDLTGTANPILLSPLGYYGGITKTRHLLAGSPAIDIGASNPLGLSDQRGFTRIVNNSGDAGAVETGPVQIVNTTGSVSEVTTSLSAALSGSVIRFDPTVFPATISLSSEITIANGRSVFLDASNIPGGVTLDAGSVRRHFQVPSNSGLAMDSIILTNGFNSFWGGAISAQGVVTVNRCVFFGNHANASGGAIDIVGNPLTVNNSLFLENTCGNLGGAIYLGGDQVESSIQNSTFQQNTAGNSGGAIHAYQGALRIDHTTITENAATGGGGISVAENGLTRAILSASILRNNTADDIALSIGSAADAFFSNGGNIVGTGHFDILDQFDKTGDLVGNDQAILLTSLHDFGGFTQTRMLLPGSPAIQATPFRITTPLFDQTGRMRRIGGFVDSGAVQAYAITAFGLPSTGLDRIPDILKGPDGPYPHLQTVGSNTALDTDGDGFADEVEILVSTDLYSSNDFPKILSINIFTGFGTLVVKTFPGIDYQIKEYEDLSSAAVSTTLLPTATEHATTHIFGIDTPQRFFRATIDLPDAND